MLLKDLVYIVADVAQLVRAADCGSAGRGFKSRRSPHLLPSREPGHTRFHTRARGPLKRGRNEYEHTLHRFRCRPGLCGKRLRICRIAVILPNHQATIESSPGHDLFQEAGCSNRFPGPQRG